MMVMILRRMVWRRVRSDEEDEDEDEDDAEAGTDTYADADAGSEADTMEEAGTVIKDNHRSGDRGDTSGGSGPSDSADGNDIVVPIEEMVVEQAAHSLQGTQLGHAVQVPRPPQYVLSIPEKVLHGATAAEH